MSSQDVSPNEQASSEAPAHRYNAQLANEIEAFWQQTWAKDETYNAPNPSGELSKGFEQVKGLKKAFVMDMFPYPSGSGLHVGHPLGFIATDIYARFLRMTGHNVLHTMGFDAFGLPAEQYAVQTGMHPRTTTEDNIKSFRHQLAGLGLGHDTRRSVATTDREFVRFTQWIFLQLFNAWYNPDLKKAQPISGLIADLESSARKLDSGKDWTQLSETEKREELLNYRLAYTSEANVNWCPQLGTVLANEEVTKDNRSERGNFPVFRRPLSQWMMRITAYADRLVDDLDTLNWPESVKSLQRNWVGRSVGASVDFAIADDQVFSGEASAKAGAINVFTTRPDTLFGATYVVVSPEHPAVQSLIADEWPADTRAAWKGPLDSDTPRHAVETYCAVAANHTDIERQAENREKTGVFTGRFAVNPVNGNRIPIFVGDYVLAHYGTGAIMAVPAHDQRDFEFAKALELPIVEVIKPTHHWLSENGLSDDTPADAWPSAFVDAGTAVRSHNAGVSLDGLKVEDAKVKICQWLESQHLGKATTVYKLRDWLFSRQRYWGEPFPIVWDEDGTPIALDESMLPIELPEVENFAPTVVDANDDTVPEAPLGRADGWKQVRLDLGDGEKTYRRELNTMPNWAGSCAYYLRYIDPNHTDAAGDATNEQYWMNVDLYVGGVEHAVLHLLYSRFWHKALYDLGYVSTIEPFQRLVNQGYVLADAFTDERGMYVDANNVVKTEDGFVYDGRPVKQHTGKMGKSLKNSVDPDFIREHYGADSLRLYEMAMGPIDADRPWTNTGIIGLFRFLQRFWRNIIDEDTGQPHTFSEPTAETSRLVHKTIAGVRDDFENFRFNTAIAKLIELSNHVTKNGGLDREGAEAMILMIAPMAPHVAEELWARVGHESSVTRADFPQFDPAMLKQDMVEVPVQVLGKLRGKVSVPTGCNDEALQEAALKEPNVARHIEGKTIRKVVIIPDKLVNIVAN